MNTIITKENCPKCDQLKGMISECNNVIFIDSKSVDGMALLSYHEIYNEKTPFPLMITEDERVIYSSIEIRKILKGEAQ